VAASADSMLGAMCGIAGVRRFDRNVDHVIQADRAGAAMAHRGPDDANGWHDDRMALAFRRLAIVGVHDGRQPLIDEDERFVLAGNGEIYNHRELRAGLEARGHRLRTHSDLEVVLHLYQEQGPASFSLLRGMYAFAIWDTATGELVCCRDPFGIKPLYYQHDATAFRFASELPALADAMDAIPAMRPETVLRFLTFQYVPEPDTAVAGVSKLPAGHYVTVAADGTTELHRWWTPQFTPTERSFDDYVDEVRAAIADSVHIHRSSEVEQGAFLSGGIDSSLTSALANRTSPTPTFSVGFGSGIDELEAAGRAATALGTEHHPLRITDQMAFEGIDPMIAHLGEPLADPAALGLFYVSQLAATRVTTVLSGEGADELFLGYRLYDEPRALAPFERLPASARRLAASVARRLPDVRGRDWVLRGATPLERRYIGNGRVGSADTRASVLSADWSTPAALAEPYAASDAVYAESIGMDDVRRMQHLDLHLWLPGDILTKADRLSMAHSLELRVPFLDRVVWDAASRIPVGMQLDAHTTKKVLRAAAADVLPPDVCALPKLGFPVPVRTWMRGPWGASLRDELAGDDLGGVVDPTAVVAMLDEHRAGTADHSRVLWALMILGRWNRQFCSRTLARLAPRPPHDFGPATT
jgi:asparagine synthase (glutamine-hydrolysing)